MVKNSVGSTYSTFLIVEIVTPNADRLRRVIGNHAFPKHCIDLLMKFNNL